MMTQTDYTGGAAQVCNDYTNENTGVGVYSDGYLPSRDELASINPALDIVGMHRGSSEASYSGAWVYNFGSATPTWYWKWTSYRVRAVRSF